MDILCTGEMLADIMVKNVDTVTFDNDCTPVDQILIKPGGDSFNNSIDLAKLGNSVTYVGRIGSDAIGSYLVQEGKTAGVCMDHVVYSSTPHTKMNILINEKGDRAFHYFPGTSAEFTVGDIDFSLLDDCKIVQVGGTFHLPRFDGNGTAELFWEARKRGVLTSMDVTKDFTGRWNEVIAPCYPYLDYFLPSIEQAELIAGTSDENDIADFFLSRGIRNVGIKLGTKGFYFKNRETAFYCSCYQVPVAETTGAGDAFVSGFLTGLLKEFSHEDCAKFGTACSAFVVQKVGATAGMKDFDEVMGFIKAQKPLKISY